MTMIMAMTPSHRLDARIAIAASRAGEIGILDLGWMQDPAALAAALDELRRKAGGAGRWGVRWDAFGHAPNSLSALSEILSAPVDILVLAGLGREEAAKVVESAHRLGEQVILEVFNSDAALAAQASGYDGLVVKGYEAGGRVGKSSSFIMLQELRGKIDIPYWMQGGVGIESAAAATLAGATGVVLAEQLWLTAEGPYGAPDQKSHWSGVDGSETAVVGRDAELFRLSNRHGRSKLRELDLAVAKDDDWQCSLERSLRANQDPLIPLGQDIAFAESFERLYATTGQVIAALRAGIDQALSQAKSENPLRPDSPLAKTHGVRYPIVQGPMTRVSDVAPFAAAVAEGGGLPFLALAVMRGEQARELLLRTREHMGDRPWGVGILGFMPLDLREEQVDAIRAAKPPFAIIAGGRPSQARELEALGVSAYLHVPSPGLLQKFLKDGARKFIFEGSECGGHTGPRTSFILWEAALETLLTANVPDPESIQVLFAGGIHDAASAAIVSVFAARLSARKMKVGILMGTAYLFTEEAVRAGAVVQTFQDEAIACDETVLLKSSTGVYTRCARTAFCAEFENTRRQLVLDAKADNDILVSLELLNVGRLRIASKGVTRNEGSIAGDGSDRYIALDEATQRRDGLYMMGEVARLKSDRLSIAELHKAVSVGAGKLLADAAIKRHGTTRSRPHVDIAVVGMACLMPGADDLRAYWQNILKKVCAIRETPHERWRPEDYFDPVRATPDKVYSKWGGFLDDIAFDPVRYGIPPASLPSIEPVQLLALHVASKALEDAGYDRRPFPRERTATIFAAGAMNEVGTLYVFRTLLAHLMPKVKDVPEEIRKQIISSLHNDPALPKWTADSFPGFLSNVISGRIANRLDLRGANFTVDAACASALAALDVGVRQLRDGDADVALVGSADCANGAVAFMSFAQTHALSPRGRCQPFDDNADGIVLGEGIAAVVLKRLEDAERDGDRIYAVLKGVGSSSDGHNRSMTAPDVKGQVLAMERAYADAGVDPASVTLIEAHGTGTAVGDRSELKALSVAFATEKRAPQSCALGSVKSMIGHTKITAGLASLIKAGLALKHRVLPPTLGVERPCSRVDLAETPFYVNTELRPWFAGAKDRPRRCGVSSFGFGGANFHAVLEEYRGDYRATDRQDLSPRAAEIIAFGRGNSGEVKEAAKSLLESLSQLEKVDLAQLAYSAHLDEAKIRPKNGGQLCQLAIVANSVTDLKSKLEFFLSRSGDETSMAAPQGVYYRNQAHRHDAGAICMLFPGQGSQQIDMLRDLVVSRPSSYDLFERADALLGGELPRELSRYIYPPPCFAKDEVERRQAELNDTRVAQPALGVVNLAAFDILSEFGLKPNFVAGHSYGEYVALCVAGAISRDDLICLSYARGSLSAEASAALPMTMAAVNASEQRVVDAITRLGLAVRVANINAPDQTIIAGRVDEIEAAIKALTRESLRVKRLAVTAAFHCDAMAEARDGLAAALANVEFRRPHTRIFSNTTAAPFPEEPDAIRALLARHMVEPLRFVDEIKSLYDAGARVFIEAGPGQVLSGLVGRILRDQPHVTLGLDAPERPGWLQLAHLLAQAFALGLPVDLEPWFRQRGLAAVSVAQALEEAYAKTHPSPTAWRVNGGRAAPWHGPAQQQKPTAAPEVLARIPAQETPQPIVHSASQPVVEAQTTRTESSRGNNVSLVHFERRAAVRSLDSSPASAEPLAPAARSRLVEAQCSLSQIIELQREQQQVLQRFIAFQENWLLGRVEEANVASSMAPAPAETQSAPIAIAKAEAVNAPPAPVLPKFIMTKDTKSGPIQSVPLSLDSPPPPVSPEPGGPRANGGKEVQGIKVSLAPTQKFKADLVNTVAERTGYGADMLDLDAHMEADLGIDSIKRIEILSKLKEQYPFMEGRDEEVVFEELAGLKTLNEVIAWYDKLHSTQAEAGGSDLSKKAATPPSVSLPETVESASVKASSADVRRYAVTAVPAPRTDVAKVKGLPADQLILLVGDAPALSAAFRGALRAKQLRVRNVLRGDATRFLDEDAIQVDFGSVEAVAELRKLIIDSGEKVGTIFNMAGMETTEIGVADQELEQARRLFLLLKVFEKDLKESAKAGGGGLVNLTSFDGQFGLRQARAFPTAAAGTLGVAKSIAQEWPAVRVKCIDVDPKVSPARLVAEALREIGSDDAAVEVGFTQDCRWRLAINKDSARAADLSGLELDPGGVVLATGGGYGITAEVAKGFAEKFKPRLVLVGHSPVPGEEPEETRGMSDRAQLRQFFIERLRATDSKTTPARVERALQRLLKDRRIRANIEAMRAAGAQVEYHPLDVRDSQGFERLIDSIYERWGRIEGVLHGAGAIDDKLIREKTLESFEAVFTTKVAPAMVLARKLQAEKLKFLIFFSSIAGRFGNVGQCDYAAANEVMNKLADRLSHDWPHVHTVAINWGPWDGGMVSEELCRLYASKDIHPIAIERGREYCFEELSRGKTGKAEIVVTASLEQIARLASRQ